jgi:hypothetical protein
MLFDQNWHPLEGAPRITATAEEIEREPMLYNCAQRQTLRMGGDLTVRLLAAIETVVGFLPGDFSLDTRSHMLMRGWYPAIPGWHHDDIDRAENGQPDYDRAPRNDGRLMYTVVVDASDQPTGCMTEFLARGERVSVPWPVPEDRPVYSYWDAHIENECRAPRANLEDGVITVFDQGDFHRAMPAKATGWRWFARLTINPGPRGAPAKIRRQAQVYLPVTNKGW